VVKKVIKCFNEANYLEYMGRREEIMTEITRSGFTRIGDGDMSECKTNMSWSGVGGIVNDPVEKAKNEYYLFHGTNPTAADLITGGDFRVDLSGSNAGTLYGRGIYFAECCSKSDEYTQPDEKTGLRTLLLCRVSCGRINYRPDPWPDAGELVTSCVGKGSKFHCVLGDREKCRGTFREYIVYDRAQAYPEWIIWYEREA